jgi:hypothetical protein
LRWKFDLTTFDDGETIEDYALCLSGMATHLATLGEEVKDIEIVTKMLRSLLSHFKQITIVIKTLFDVSYVCCRSNRAVEGGRGGVRGSINALQQDGKLYLTEEWDARRKKRETENHYDSSAGKSCGRDGSSSGGSLNKPTDDECRHCVKMGHWAREYCSKPKKEQVHVMQDEEGSLLLKQPYRIQRRV